MEKIKVISQRDINTLNTVVDYNLHLLFGKNNLEKINYYKNELLNNIKRIDIIPYGSNGRWISSQIPGTCLTHSNGTSEVEMYSFIPDKPWRDLFTIHEYSHELWHAIINLFNYEGTKGKTKKTFDIEGRPVTKIAFAGYIFEIDEYENSKTRTLGKMIMETSIDIITSASFIANNHNYRQNGTTVDTVFKERFDKWNDTTTGYSIFTSLTRLWIAAFSNNGNISYDKTFQNGLSIFDNKTKLANGNTIITNSFLHNLVHNPFAIEEEFDQMLGRGKYERLMSQIDQVFEEYIKTRQFTPETKKIIKKFMIELSNFTNARLEYLKSINMITQEESSSIIANYNKIWNSLQKEYSTFFTSDDITDIYKKAYSYKNKYNNKKLNYTVNNHI